MCFSFVSVYFRDFFIVDEIVIVRVVTVEPQPNTEYDYAESGVEIIRPSPGEGGNTQL